MLRSGLAFELRQGSPAFRTIRVAAGGLIRVRKPAEAETLRPLGNTLTIGRVPCATARPATTMGRSPLRMLTEPQRRYRRARFCWTRLSSPIPGSASIGFLSGTLLQALVELADRITGTSSSFANSFRWPQGTPTPPPAVILTLPLGHQLQVVDHDQPGGLLPQAARLNGSPSWSGWASRR